MNTQNSIIIPNILDKIIIPPRVCITGPIQVLPMTETQKMEAGGGGCQGVGGRCEQEDRGDGGR